jgi:excisionase family DNA binding protein
MPQTAASPQLLTVAQAASLLRVSEKTMRRWIDADRVPYLRLPSGGYRIPQGALLASLGGTYNLADELAELDARAGSTSDEDVRKAAVDD